MIDSWDSFVELQEYFLEQEYEYFTFDLETDSVQEKTAKIYGLGLCVKDNEAFYIPVRKPTGELFWTEQQLKSIYTWIYKCCRKKLLGHNIIYDCLVFENNSGYDISPFIFCDTILLKHTLDEERPFGLKEVSVKYLGEWADKAQEALYASIEANGGSTTKDNLQMFKANTDVLGEYCGYDVVLTRKLFDLFSPRLKAEGLEDLFYNKEIMPLYKEVIIDMKRKGFPIDIEYFRKLKEDITKEIDLLESGIMSELKPLVGTFEQELLDKKYKISNKGEFPKFFAGIRGIALPTNKFGSVTLAKDFIATMMEQLDPLSEAFKFYEWVGFNRCNEMITREVLKDIQLKKYFASNPDTHFVFNLKSNDHLGWLFFSKLNETPLSKTEGGKPQCDEDFLDSVAENHAFVKKLIDYRKLLKLSSTYIDGILDRQVEGVVHTSYLMFGTTSGRFSSRDPNLQNLPRIKEDDAELSPLVLHYTNSIKKGFVAPKGYKLVNADYSALEPRCFCEASGDKKLKEVFLRGHDLYSQIAIDVFGIEGCSSDPAASNYLKKKHPEKRQKSKIFALAIVYGAEAGRIAEAMGISYSEAARLIEDYLDAYPDLRKYMLRCDMMAKKYGYVKTEFGRIRHLPLAKQLHAKWGDQLLDRRFAKSRGLGDIRYKLKNMLNNGKNFPIQGMAAHIVNRSMLALKRAYVKNNIEGWIAGQTHDEITAVIREDQAELASQLMKDIMENTVKISIPMVAAPIIGNNWAEVK
jgi:DNA polymerase I-like protein with 3'-5' exonuclease and polymerase domains